MAHGHPQIRPSFLSRLSNFQSLTSMFSCRARPFRAQTCQPFNSFCLLKHDRLPLTPRLCLDKYFTCHKVDHAGLDALRGKLLYFKKGGNIKQEGAQEKAAPYSSSERFFSFTVRCTCFHLHSLSLTSCAWNCTVLVVIYCKAISNLKRLPAQSYPLSASSLMSDGIKEQSHHFIFAVDVCALKISKRIHQ